MALWSSNPFPAAFSLTTGAAVFLTAGAIGYDLSLRGRALHSAWVGAPIRWELDYGAVFAVAAIVAWGFAIRVLRRS